MQALFVHGMGRSPLSGWPLVWKLRRAGVRATTFGYSTAFESFADIQRRLALRFMSLAREGAYVVIGHSLGGVLLRAALAALPPGVPLPDRLFLLGSPVRASRMAQRLARNPMFRALTRDCGKLLASDNRMAAIGKPDVPITAVVGTRTLPFGLDPFPGESSDGVVALSEVDAEWLDERVPVSVIHTILPSSFTVAKVIVEKITKQ